MRFHWSVRIGDEGAMVKKEKTLEWEIYTSNTRNSLCIILNTQHWKSMKKINASDSPCPPDLALNGMFESNPRNVFLYLTPSQYQYWASLIPSLVISSDSEI